MDRRRKVLLALPSHAGSALFKEIFKQLDFHIQIDWVWSESEIPEYLRKHPPRWSPGLIVFENMPAKIPLAMLFGDIRERPAYRKVPVVFFVSATEHRRLQEWADEKTLYVFPRVARPSELKYCLARALDHYWEPAAILARPRDAAGGMDRVAE